MQSPELTLIIARSMRAQSGRATTKPHTLPRTSAMRAFRSSAGNMLVTIGSRIAQEPRPANTRLPAGQISMAGSTDR